MENPGDRAMTGNAVDILVDGFVDDPFFVWTTPDKAARCTLLDALFSLAVDAATARGFLQLDERRVVVIVPPHQKLYDSDQAAAAEALLRNAFQRPLPLLDDYQRRLRSAGPDADDAWYLQYLAVPAVNRSQGQGSSLMCEILAEIGDAPLWLHTARPATLAFYAKFGLKIAAVTPCEPAGPSVYTLLRSPRG